MKDTRRSLRGLLAILLALALLAVTSCTPVQPSPESSAPSSEVSVTPPTPDEQMETLTTEFFHYALRQSQLSLHFLYAEPEKLGIEKADYLYGPDDDQEYYEWLDRLREELAAIDREQLSESNQLDYDILTYTLSCEEDAEAFAMYEQPLAPTIGIQVQQPLLLAEYTFYRESDIEDYFELLAGLDEYYEEVLVYTEHQAVEEILMADSTIETIIESCEAYLEDPESGVMVTSFTERLEELPGLTQEQKDRYIERNLELVTGDFVRAYTLLVDGLEALKGKKDEAMGLAGSLPDGQEYYEYLLRSEIQTSYESAPELAEAIEARMMDDVQEMWEMINADNDLYMQILGYTSAFTDPQEALEFLKEACAPYFPEPPAYTYEIREVSESLRPYTSPAFYLMPPLDRYEDNVIYINPGNDQLELTLFTTMAHEGVPGHLYQTVYTMGEGMTPMQRLFEPTSYSEGWATYVELFAYGLEEGTPEPLRQVMALNTAVMLGQYALMDYYIHYRGWDLDEFTSYVYANFGYDAQTCAILYDYIVGVPLNYMQYYAGYLEMIEMREEAEERLGESFDLLEFHTFLLDLGPAPFPIIRTHFEAWLSGQQA